MNKDKLFKTADKLYDDEKFERAFELFLKAAEAGDTSSMTRVALMYSEGVGTKKDIEKSLFWDKKAAENGDSSGALNAAISFKQLNLLENACDYFEQALRLGNGEAAFELALINSENHDLSRKYLNLCVNHENVSEYTRQKAKELLEDS